MDGMITNGTVLTLGGVYLLSQTAYVLVGIWARFRRSPPIDQTLQNYVRRDEFDKLRDELRRTDAKLFDLVRAVTDRAASFQQGIAMQLGRIDSALSTQQEILKKILQK